MFCFQCEQSKNVAGCSNHLGVCGKDEKTAIFQDVLVHSLKGLAYYTKKMKGSQYARSEYYKIILEGLFTTVTNVNFDSASVKSLIKVVYDLKEEAKSNYLKYYPQNIDEPKRLRKPEDFVFSEIDNIILSLGFEVSIVNRQMQVGKSIAGLEELIMYGLKGLAAYAEHSYVLDYKDNKIFEDIAEILDFLNYEHTIEELVQTSMRVGELNLRVMELLDKAHNEVFGSPVPSPVRITAKKGKAILVSGHDLRDLKVLLEQTADKGINIYTHGEMLPAHGYPELNKYPHLAGNYGGAWQDQSIEFVQFPGPILMTTNCIQMPRESYKNRIFTTGLVEWSGVTHLQHSDFQPLIAEALNQPGFAEDEEEKTILTGFGHNAVLGVADKVIDAVKAGQIKHFFLIGGCDGAKSGRNYYTEFALQAPKDTVILTLACGKFRFNKYEFGDIGGIPRLLDIGQCNDAYSAIKIASALANAFDTDVNSLPLSMILSWYEQKAVAILLTLLYLGIKNIKLGPSLPKFLEPEILQFLIDNFNIAPITTVEEDMKECLKSAV